MREGATRSTAAPTTTQTSNLSIRSPSCGHEPRTLAGSAMYSLRPWVTLAFGPNSCPSWRMRKTRICASALLGQVDQHASVSMRHAFPDALGRPGRTHSGFQGKCPPPSARQSPLLGLSPLRRHLHPSATTTEAPGDLPHIGEIDHVRLQCPCRACGVVRSVVSV